MEPDRRDDPYPYVRRIVVTGAASWRRLRVTQEIVSLPARDPPPPTPPRPSPSTSGSPALASLPPRMRAALVLRYVEDLSETATAQLMGCSVPTVKSHTVRGLARLRVLLAAPDRPRSRGVLT